METQKPKPIISLHWCWIPPVIILALAIFIRVLLRTEIESLSPYGESVVDSVVILSPVLGLIIPVCLLARKRRQT